MPKEHAAIQDQAPERGDTRVRRSDAESFYQMLGRLLTRRWKRECDQSGDVRTSESHGQTE